MKTSIAITAAASFLCLASAAHAQSISCPVEALELSVTTELPQPWIPAPPVRGTLTASEIRTEGETVTLVCVYGEAGAVSREMPEEFEECAPAPGGFACTPVMPAQLIARGRATLAVRAGFDFDTGTEQADRRLNDLWFTGTTTGQPVLEAFNNTMFWAVPPDRPGRLNVCQDGSYEAARVIIGADVEVGGSVCYQTEEGRFGIFNIVRADQNQLRIRFRTLR